MSRSSVMMRAKRYITVKSHTAIITQCCDENVLSDAVVAVVLVCCGVPFSFLFRRAMRCHNERDGTTAAGGQADLAGGSSREDDDEDDDDAEELVDSTEWLRWWRLP